MNCSTYIFGDFELGYSQYPDDFTNLIFQSEQFKPKAKTQIAIHKDGNLVYYVYYRSLDDKKDCYVGLSIVFNGLICKDIAKLFRLFEDAVTSMLVSGKIIEFSDDGSLTSKATRLYLEKTEIERITQTLVLSVNQIPSSDFCVLPPVNLSVGTDEVFSVSADEFAKHYSDILTSHNRVLVLKDKDFNSAQMSGYASRLNKLYKEKKKLQEENESIRKRNEQLNRQKKQVTVVVVLVVVLSACLIGLILFNNNVNRLNSEISEHQAAISDLSKVVERRDFSLDSLRGISDSRLSTINSLKSDQNNLKKTIKRKNATLDSLSDAFTDYKFTITQAYPLIVNDIEIANTYKGGKIQTDYGRSIYSHETMYLCPKIKYQGLKNCRVNLKVRWYKPNGELSRGDSSPAGFSQSELCGISMGEGCVFMSGWGNENKGHWSSGSYRIEVWYENVCLKAKSFTIY